MAGSPESLRGQNKIEARVRDPYVGSKSRAWHGTAAVGSLTFAYLYFWYDRFIGASSNVWHFFYGRQILAGKVPYRDFYMYVPPLHPLSFTALIALFGDSLIAGRILGVVERVISAVVLYLWLTRIFRVPSAFWGAFVAIIVSCGDSADALSLHHHDSLLWAIVAGLFASHTISARSQRRTVVLSVLTGFAASLCLLSKQTTGAGVSLVLPIVISISLLRLHGSARARLALAGYAAGWAIPAGLVAAWLWRMSALAPFIEQVFVKGPSSKGPLWIVLSRPVIATVYNPGYSICAIIATLLLAVIYSRFRGLGRIRINPSPGHASFFGAFAMAAGGLGLGLYLGLYRPIGSPILFLRTVQYVAVYVSLIGSAAAAIYFTAICIGRNFTITQAQCWILSAVSFSACYMLSLSWPAYEPMVTPALGFLVAWWLNAVECKSNGNGPSQAWIISTLSCVLLIMGAVWLKLEAPFHWEGWKEPPVVQSTATSTLPALRGLRLAPGTIAVLERITRDIRENSKAGDQIFVFPHLPIFYVLSERQPSTFAYVHWWDVAPDYLSQRDAQTLREHPPSVLVLMDFSADEIRKQEESFRGAAQSGQRDLLSTLNGFRQSYIAIDSVMAPGGDHKISVFARPGVPANTR